MDIELETAVIEAAGGVVEEPQNGTTRVAIIGRERYGPEWALPKGKRKPGESWQETALREVEEEIGLGVKIVGLAAASTYLAAGRPKLVLYWKMRLTGDKGRFPPDGEVKEVRWLSLEAASQLLTHNDDKAVLKSVFQGSAGS